MVEITKGLRIINYVIDLFCITVFSSLIGNIFKIYNPNLIYYLIYLVYYFSFEDFLGQTIGKLITKTNVVDMYNQKPSLWRIFLRTILRLNPLDAFSYLFGQEQGAHDLLSKTRLKYKEWYLFNAI